MTREPEHTPPHGPRTSHDQDDVRIAIETAQASSAGNGSWRDHLGSAWLGIADHDFEGPLRDDDAQDHATELEGLSSQSVSCPNPVKMTEAHQLEEHIRLSLATLASPIRKAVGWRYGLEGDPESYAAIGHRLNITGTRARTLVERGTSQLRHSECRDLLRRHLDNGHGTWEPNRGGIDRMDRLQAKAEAQTSGDVPGKANERIPPSRGSNLSIVMDHILGSIAPRGFVAVDRLHYDRRTAAIAALEKERRVLRVPGTFEMVMRIDDRPPYGMEALPAEVVLETIASRVNIGLERLRSGRHPTRKQLERMTKTQVVEIVDGRIIPTDKGRDRLRRLDAAIAVLSTLNSQGRPIRSPSASTTPPTPRDSVQSPREIVDPNA